MITITVILCDKLLLFFRYFIASYCFLLLAMMALTCSFIHKLYNLVFFVSSKTNFLFRVNIYW